MTEKKITFTEMEVDGSGRLHQKAMRVLAQSAILACPHYIMMPEHFNQDSSCRCTDPDHTEMAEWGYTWDGKQWVSEEEDEEEETK